MKTIIFDFDGVFTDSFETTLESIQALHKKFQLVDISGDDLRELFCGNFWEEHKKYGLGEEKENAFKKELLSLVENRQSEIQIFPGIKEIITCLRKEGFTLIIISSNKTSTVEEKLATIGLKDFFTKIYGADKPGNKKEKMKGVLDKIGENSSIFFVTDTLGDLKEMQEFSLTTIATTWGFHPRDLLEKGQPHYLVSTPKELLTVLDI